MSLVYDGRKVIPAPLVTLSKKYRTTEDGRKVGAGYDISLRGTLLPFRGSPSGHYTAISGAFWTDSGYPPDEPYQENNENFHSILRKQEAMRWLFSQDGRSLEWQAAGGQPVVKCNPRVLGMDFPEGTWADRCDYTINLEADHLYINGTLSSEDTFASTLIVSAGEEWSFDEMSGWEGSGIRLTHTVRAQGIVGYDETGALRDGKEAWQHAKTYCDAKATGGIEQAIVEAVAGSGWFGGSYTKSASVDETGGTYAVTETWLIAPTNTFVEREFSVDYDSTSDEYRVRYQGTITAIAAGQRAGSKTALEVAKGALPTNADARAEALQYVGTMLNGRVLAIGPETRSVALNQREGTISFTIEWTTTTNPTHTIDYEASISYSPEDDHHALSLSCTIVGKGDTSAIRLANARAVVPTEAAAQAKALEIIGGAPAGVVFNAAYKSKSTQIVEKQGRIAVSWTWDNSLNNDLDVSVQINQPSDVTAILPIPGRTGGPIIQNMNTKTEKTAQITIRGRRYAARPNSATMRAMADSYLGIPAIGFYVAGDTENWNPTTKNYDRSIRYLIKEGY